MVELSAECKLVGRMVGVAQLAERWLVEPEVAGSSPVVHPHGMAPLRWGHSFLAGATRADLAGPIRATEAGQGGMVSQVKASAVTSSGTEVDVDLNVDVRAAIESPWVTLVWNDPVNLMSYVSWVFRSYFGFSRDEAQKRMLEVHHDGRTVVATGSREEMERHVEAMHDFGLWATLTKADL